jgi:hypothetical protein
MVADLTDGGNHAYQKRGFVIYSINDITCFHAREVISLLKIIRIKLTFILYTSPFQQIVK